MIAGAPESGKSTLLTAYLTKYGQAARLYDTANQRAPDPRITCGQSIFHPGQPSLMDWLLIMPVLVAAYSRAMVALIDETPSALSEAEMGAFASVLQQDRNVEMVGKAKGQGGFGVRFTSFRLQAWLEPSIRSAIQHYLIFPLSEKQDRDKFEQAWGAEGAFELLQSSPPFSFIHALPNAAREWHIHRPGDLP